MASLQATLRARLPLAASLSEMAEQLDEEIAHSTPLELFLTLFVVMLNGQDTTHNMLCALTDAFTVSSLPGVR